MSVVERAQRRVGGACLALACLALGVGRAQAAAWNRPAGTGLVIADFTLNAGTDYFDGGGKLAPARAYAKEELAAYVEYGLTDDITLVARPSLDRVEVGAPGAGRFQGIGRTEVAAQWQALLFGPAALAVQGGFTLPGAGSRNNPALAGDKDRDAELRVLGGVGLPLPFRPFVNLEGAYRARSGGAPSEWHGDATVGLYPTERLLLLVQSFSRIPTGPSDAGWARSRSTEVGVKAVYALTQSWSVQVGAFTTVSGRDALRERGVTTGLWHLF